MINPSGHPFPLLPMTRQTKEKRDKQDERKEKKRKGKKRPIPSSPSRESRRKLHSRRARPTFFPCVAPASLLAQILPSLLRKLPSGVYAPYPGTLQENQNRLCGLLLPKPLARRSRCPSTDCLFSSGCIGVDVMATPQLSNPPRIPSPSIHLPLMPHTCTSKALRRRLARIALHGGPSEQPHITIANAGKLGSRIGLEHRSTDASCVTSEPYDWLLGVFGLSARDSQCCPGLSL